MPISPPSRGRAPAPWVQTYGGRKFDVLAPDPYTVCPVDIAFSLANSCRYNGHTREFYSVAEHCVLIHDAAPQEHRLWALLHDASEAYVGDIVRPLKHQLPQIAAIEARAMEAIAEGFGLFGDQPDWVTRADHAILRDEMEQAFGPPPADWNIPAVGLGVTLEFWPPHVARVEFLRRLLALRPLAKNTPRAGAKKEMR